MDNYSEILDYIESSYRNEKFDLNHFEFYKTRKEKRKNSVGILNWKDKKYFFKIVKEDEYNNEDKIKEKIKPNFKIVEKYSERQIENETLNLYEYVDAPKINSFNYLRNRDISIEEKNIKLNEYFTKKIEFMNNTYSLECMTGTKKADRWFFERIKKGSRFDNFYGENGIKLLEDIKVLYNNGVNNYEQFFKYVFEYMKKSNNTIESFCHGDFHDFNFTLDGLFWDIDTFDMNPVMNDFAVYYWHFYGREDALIYKYSPWLTNYMYNSLSDEELYKVRKLKENCILRWYDAIEKLYIKCNISEGIKDEFIFKLFCRAFLIDNVLNYDEKDREMLYEFFDYFLNNKEKSLKDLLFTNPIKFFNIEV